MSSTPGGKPPRVRRPLRASLSRRTRRVTIASALLLLAGLVGSIAGISAASGAGGSHAVRVSAGYSCRFPSATYQVSAVITATFPASAATGTAIQPAGLHMTVTLPAQAVGYLRGLGAANVTASGSLSVTATSRQTPAPATWPVHMTASAALPATGSLTLAATGTATSAVASASGTVTFATTGLDLVLDPRAASGAAASPATVSAACATTSGASTRLASVSVTSTSPSPSASASSSPSHPAAASKKPPAKNRVPKGCGDIKVHGYGEPVCGYIVGYSDVKKLYGASLIGPVLVNVDFAYRHVITHGNLIAYSTGRVYNQADHGKPVFPPVRSTFLGFGFVPVTATLSLTERGPISIVSVSGVTKPPYPIKVTATSRVAIKVSDVKVNGVPLAVGPSCQAAYPAKLVLVGHGFNTLPPRGYTVPTGGPLSGTLTIPPFVHCGVTQNLDPLLTGSIAGAGNFAKMTQGKLCGPLAPSAWTCPPPKPKPSR